MDKVRIDNLSFAYEQTDRLILKGLDMSVEVGDFCCILGQSGCGKSTLLRLLAGLEKPTEGSILVDDKQITGASLSRSVVFQDYGLFPWMNTGDNLVLALRQRFPEKSKKELQETARSYLADVGLDPDAVYHKYPKALSGGMKQRCAIARSFSIDPPILLMDEPFGALDAVTRAKLQDMVLKLWKKEEPKKTVFFVTHDVDEALLLATKIVVLGQSPSHIIYQCDIDSSIVRNRETIYENDYIMGLRNELIKVINADVDRKVNDEGSI